MANVHTYFGIENLALTNGQRATLVSGLQALGLFPDSPQPAERNHWRIRTDGNAAIFEALFDETNIGVVAIKNRLAGIFGIDVSLVSHTTQVTAYGLLATFTRAGTDYIRMIAFGYNGGWPTWEASRQTVLAYLADNAAAWGDV